MRSRTEAGSRRRPESAPEARDVRIPHDVVNEQVVIAAAIVDEHVRRKLVGSLGSDYFFGKGHAEVWAVVAELTRQGLHYDPATVRQMSNGAVDTKYLDELVENRPEVPPNLRYHVEMLQWDRQRIEAARGPVNSLLEALRKQSTEPDKVRALAKSVATSFDGVGSQRYLRDPAALVSEQVKSLFDRRLGQVCYAYGIDGLDVYDARDENAGEPRLVPGSAPGQVTVVTGTSGSGKTTLTANIMLGMANMGRRVLCGAWEQGSGPTLELMATFSLGFARKDVLLGRLGDEDIDRMRVEMERISQHVRFFEIPFGRAKGEKQSNDRNLDLVHQYISDSGCDVFVADLWRRSLRQTDPEEEEHALYRQQAIAQETRCHCILIHQQRLKDLEQRPDKRPTREGLKGSGAWVEVADTILGMHRPALYKNVPDDRCEIIVLKQRHGAWPLAVEFDWDAKHGSIRNGRTIAYDQPAETDDPFDVKDKKWKGKGSWS